MTYYDFVSEPRFFEFLLKIDKSIAAEAHQRPCSHCGGQLDRGDFLRSGFGMPNGVSDDLRRRFSFCCRDENCRKRLTPESLRFMRGMAYTTIVITLATAIHQGLSTRHRNLLRQKLSVSRQTIYRWIKWWRQCFVSSPFWRAARGRFIPSVDEGKVAASLLETFVTQDRDVEQSIKKLLQFLAPFRAR